METADSHLSTAASNAVGFENDGGPSGLIFKVAATLDDVQSAWGCVYDAYRRIEIIEPNIYSIHTNAHAATAHSAVFVGQLGDETRTTMTTIHDSEMGLPLDSVFPIEIDCLRKSGRRLSEAGLFGDRRAGIGRSASALLNLMRLVFFYAVPREPATIIAGVHPHHAGFYQRMLGFQTLSETRQYPAVRDNPVVLLHMQVPELVRAPKIPRGVAYFLDNPCADEEFALRYRFSDEAFQSSRIALFLAENLAPDASSR
jgi:hypothetical protein